MPTTIDGFQRPELLRRLAVRLDELNYCARLQFAAPDAGTLSVRYRWTILTSGEVTEVSCRSGPSCNTAFARCLEQVIPFVPFLEENVPGPPVEHTFYAVSR